MPALSQANWSPRWFVGPLAVGWDDLATDEGFFHHLGMFWRLRLGPFRFFVGIDNAENRRVRRAEQLDRSVLPDFPGVWSRDIDGYRQRWMSGAFGSREDISDVWAWVTVEDEWVTETEGITRTITRAEVVRTISDARASGDLI